MSITSSLLMSCGKVVSTETSIVPAEEQPDRFEGEGENNNENHWEDDRKHDESYNCKDRAIVF